MTLESGQEPVFAKSLQHNIMNAPILDKDITFSELAMEMEHYESGLGINILDLPNEVLLKIFSNLSPEDISQNVALVCNRFLEVTRSPKLPRLVTIPSYVTICQLVQTVENCLNKYPFSKFDIQHLSIKSPDHSEPLFLIAPFIMKMRISFFFDWHGFEFPFFESLETLYIEDTHHRVKQINEIWKMCPNLINLEIVLFDYMNGDEPTPWPPWNLDIDRMLGLGPALRAPKSPVSREVS